MPSRVGLNESQQARSALVIGATGLVGSALVGQLLADPTFHRVTTFVRRPGARAHPKLTEHVVNWDEPEAWRDLVRGDVLFSALGTTLKQAGSQDAQWKVDHTYQLEVARAAAANDVACCVLVSSAGADPHSRIFYSRMKGVLERDVAGLGFNCLQILRPGLLAGDRRESRPGEAVGGAVLRVLNAIGLFRAYRPIHAETVASAMIHASRRPGTATWEPDGVFALATGEAGPPSR